MLSFLPSFFVRYFVTFSVIAVPLTLQARGASISQIAHGLIAVAVGKIVGGFIANHRRILQLPTATCVRSASATQAACAFLGCTCTIHAYVLMFLFVQGIAFAIFRPVAKSVVQFGPDGNSLVTNQCIANIVTALGTFAAAAMASGLALAIRLFGPMDSWATRAMLAVATILPFAFLFIPTFGDPKSSIRSDRERSRMTSNAHPVFLVWGASVAVYAIWHAGVPFSLRERDFDQALLATALMLQPLAFALGQLVFARIVTGSRASGSLAWRLLCTSVVLQAVFTSISIAVSPWLCVVLLVGFGGFFAALAYPSMVFLLFACGPNDEHDRRTLFARSGLAADVGEAAGYGLLAFPAIYFDMELMALPVLVVAISVATWRPSHDS